MSFLNNLKKQPFQRLLSSDWNTVIYTLQSLYTGQGGVVSQILQNGNLIIPNNISANEGIFLYKVLVNGEPVLTELDPIYIAGFIGFANTQINQVLQSQEKIYTAISSLPHQIVKTIIQSNIYLANEFYQDNVKTYKLLKEVVTDLYQVEKNILRQILLNNIYLADHLYRFELNLKEMQTKEIYLAQYVLNQIYKATISLSKTINKLSLYLSPPAITSLQISMNGKTVPLTTLPILTVKIILRASETNHYIVYIGNKNYINFPLFPGDVIEFSTLKPQNVYVFSKGPAKLYALFETLSS